MNDPRLSAVDKADLELIHKARMRYQGISITIDDAVAKLAKMVDASSDPIKGKYVEAIQEDAGKVKTSLTKAAARYHDVAVEAGKYEPKIEHAVSEVKGARDDDHDAVLATSKARGMPDPQKGADGTISPEEHQKGLDKDKATADAAAKVTAAKNRLTSALDALDIAGKEFGDKVNCKNYDDGLTDSHQEKIHAIFDQISKIFGIIGMILTAFALLIPGLNVLLIGGIVAGAVALIADIVLLANGTGSWVNVFLGALGLGLAGAGAAFTNILKGIGNAGKAIGALRPGTIVLGESGGAFQSIALNNLVSLLKPGFFKAEFMAFKNAIGNWAELFKTGGFGKFGAGYLDLAGFKNLTNFLGGSGGLSNGVWVVWGLSNISFSLGAGLGFAGFQATKPDEEE